ncbi:MAG: hypothetical protein H3C35_05665 [Bacteroidetes bacterium]|nr:hypothetical protein [Bacteroidota bacterium]
MSIVSADIIQLKSDILILIENSLPHLTVKLISSTGALLTGGTLQYYDGSWKNAVNNNNGTFTVSTTKSSVHLKMTYEYGTQQINNVTIGSGDTAVFQTINTQVQLKNSAGNLIDQGTVQYYVTSWQNFGTTNNGIAVKELLPANYTFKITYADGSNSKQQNITVNNGVVTFQTIPVQVKLQNSSGNPLDVGTVDYYVTAWRSFGTTTNGTATKELLSGNYTFRMKYADGSINKQQTISSENALVTFQTVPVQVKLQNSHGNLIDTGIVDYYVTAWRRFGITSNGIATKELLPTNYTFRVTHQSLSNNKQQNIASSNIVTFSTVATTVNVKNAQNNPINNATVTYNVGSWKNFGTTNASGSIVRELLPVNLTLRATSGTMQKTVTQNTANNPTVEIQLP